MKKVVLVSLLAAMMFSCQSNKYNVSNYFSDNQRDTLLTNIITYVFTKAPNATNETRFDAQYRQFYVKNLPSFRIKILPNTRWLELFFHDSSSRE